jgi:hypothetical protein
LSIGIAAALIGKGSGTVPRFVPLVQPFGLKSAFFSIGMTIASSLRVGTVVLGLAAAGDPITGV